MKMETAEIIISVIETKKPIALQQQYERKTLINLPALDFPVAADPVLVSQESPALVLLSP
jgi:hypothetical protein